MRQFFTSTHWYPSASVPEFGALAIFAGSGLVTLGEALAAVPLGITAAVCLSDVLPFSARQIRARGDPVHLTETSCPDALGCHNSEMR